MPIPNGHHGSLKHFRAQLHQLHVYGSGVTCSSRTMDSIPTQKLLKLVGAYNNLGASWLPSDLLTTYYILHYIIKNIPSFGEFLIALANVQLS